MKKAKLICTLCAAMMMTAVMYGGALCAGAENNNETEVIPVSETVEKSISDCEVKVTNGGYTYNGAEKKPPVTVTDGDTVLKEGTDYSLEYSDNINAGNGKVTVTGMGEYTGTKEQSFTIMAARLEGYKLSISQSELIYNGKAQKPDVTVSNKKGTLVSGKDYTVIYSENTNVGTAVVSVRGIGNYAGALSGTFKIVEDTPAEVTGMKAAGNTASTVGLSWNKVDRAEGYAIYLYNKTAKKWQLYKLTTATKLTVTGLNDGEAYAFTARAYRMKNGKYILSKTFKNFKTSTCPKQVDYKITRIGKGTADIQWTRVKGATSYAVIYKPSMNDEWRKVCVVNNRTSSYTMKSGLKYGVKGYITVRAYRNYEGVIRASDFYLRSLTPVKRDINDLKRQLDDKIVYLPGEWSVYVKNLRTQESFSLNNKQHYAASVMKLFCMTAVYQKIENGEIKETADLNYWLDELISHSSNVAFNVLVLRYGKTMVRDWIQANGYNQTIQVEGYHGGPNYADTVIGSGTNWVTPEDCGRLFEDIYWGRCISKTASAKMLRLLENQEYTYKIPASLPSGVHTANKTGDYFDVTHDCAIVWQDGEPYVVCIMCSAEGQGYQCAKHLRTLSRMIYDYFLYNK